MPRLCSSLLLSLLIAWSASAVTMEWTFIGNSGNPCDPDYGNQCFGAVDYAYHIGTYEVTNAQYAEFLNAKAASDPLGLYNTNMGNPAPGFSGHGGITRSGSSGSYIYSAIAGREDMPVNHVDFYDTLRFSNWLNNGQGSGDTETGAYMLLGGTATPSNGPTVTRNPGATIVLTNEDEWYKAAYYDAVSASYFDYPAGSGTPTACAAPTATPNSANCDTGGFSDDASDPDVDDLTSVGSFAGSASPYGTFDQGGNALEWTEESPEPGRRQLRGGSFRELESPFLLAKGSFTGSSESNASAASGFRVASIPEPSTGLLVIAGLLGLAGWRRAHA